ncbi:MAG: uroporphyrinogen decarboxylase family protein, partial [Verrucomicrobiota bacterium]
CAFGNVGKELRRLERVRLLLQELVVSGRVSSLRRLLLQRACANLRLSTLQGRFLCSLTQSSRLLGGTKALLGFGGSPWTLATYMVEGGSSDEFERIKLLFYTDRATFDLLLEKLTAALIAYFQMQIRSGADAIQIFDSWGGIIAGPDYEAASLQWIRRIIAALPRDFPVILYAKGTAPHLAAQAGTGARVLSVDWTNDLAAVRRTLPARVAVQGNLDPVLLNTTPAIVQHETARLLESMRGTAGHIFNLGHGILPQAKLECVEALVATVTGWR